MPQSQRNVSYAAPWQRYSTPSAADPTGADLVACDVCGQRIYPADPRLGARL